MRKFLYLRSVAFGLFLSAVIMLNCYIPFARFIAHGTLFRFALAFQSFGGTSLSHISGVMFVIPAAFALLCIGAGLFLATIFYPTIEWSIVFLGGKLAYIFRQAFRLDVIITRDV